VRCTGGIAGGWASPGGFEPLDGCRDVLAHLSDCLGGELAADQITRIEAHLAGCDWASGSGAASRPSSGHSAPD
jgi:hypothetical protein